MKTSLTGLSIGEKVKEKLKNAQDPVVGKVLNVFSNSLYIKCKKDLGDLNNLIIITQLPIRSPVSLNVSLGKEKPLNFKDNVYPLDKVIVKRNELLIRNLAINLTTCSSYKPVKLHIEESGFLRGTETLDLLQTGLRLLDILMNKPNIIWKSTYRKVISFLSKDIQGALGSKETAILESGLSELIGLGSGFTPSGDDFAGGFLFFFNALTPKLKLNPVFIDEETIKSRTNWVSGCLLNYMQRQIVDEEILSFTNDFLEKNENEFAMDIIDLIQRGHTTGLDFLLGFFSAASIIMDEVFGSRLKDKLLGLIRANVR